MSNETGFSPIIWNFDGLGSCYFSQLECDNVDLW